MILKDFLLTHLFFKKQPTDRVIVGFSVETKSVLTEL